MSNPLKTTSFTASEARANLYSLIKTASHGNEAFEINLRGSQPVVLMSKAELDSWLETIDILSNPQEVSAIRQSISTESAEDGIPLDQVLKELKITNEDSNSSSSQ